jgi:hypothetical protein
MNAIWTDGSRIIYLRSMELRAWRHRPVSNPAGRAADTALKGRFGLALAAWPGSGSGLGDARTYASSVGRSVHNSIIHVLQPSPHSVQAALASFSHHRHGKIAFFSGYVTSRSPITYVTRTDVGHSPQRMDLVCNEVNAVKVRPE